MNPQTLETNTVIESKMNGVNLTKFNIPPQDVQSELRKHMLVDGFDITVDLSKSKGSFLYDSKHNRKLLDFFTFVASHPLGMNHPKIDS